MRRSIKLAAMAGLLSAFSASGTMAVPAEHAYSVSPNSDGSLSLHTYRLVGSQPVDLSGVTLDQSKVRAYNWPAWWSTQPDVKFFVLREGVGRLDESGPPLPSVYTEAQAKSDADTTAALQRQALDQRPPPQAATNKPQKSLIGMISEFFRAYWLQLLSISFLPAIGGIALKFLLDWRASRNIEILYLGLPASGKTALLDRMRDPTLTEAYFDADRTTTGVEIRNHDPVVAGRYRFLLTSVDTPGSKPDAALDQIVGSRGSKQRLVLMIVLSPHGKRQESNTFSDDFVKEQLGYVLALPLALVRASKLRKPDVVIVFANKFDTFIDANSSIPDKGKEFMDRFSIHIAELRTACKERGVPFVPLYGSARRGMNTDSILSTVVNRIMDRERH